MTERTQILFVVKLLFVLSPPPLKKVHDRTNNYKAKNATVGIVKRPRRHLPSYYKSLVPTTVS